MVDYLPKPRSRSKTLLAAWEKLNAKRNPPKVNLPALARRDAPSMSCWQADPGYVFVSSDFTSLEPSITAHFSQDTNYRYATVDGVGQEPYIDHTGLLMIDDIYLMTGSVFPRIGPVIKAYFTDPINRAAWAKDSEVGKKALKKERNLAKPACLGFGYNMGPKKFYKTAYEAGLDISMEESTQMYKAYWSVFAGVKQLAKQLTEVIETQKSIINPFGYRLTPESHKAFNAVIQSSASGVMDIFALKFFSKLADKLVSFKYVACIHDEHLYQIPEESITMCEQLTKEALDETNELLGWSVPMRIGFVYGKTFAEIK